MENKGLSNLLHNLLKFIDIHVYKYLSLESDSTLNINMRNFCMFLIYTEFSRNKTTKHLRFICSYK